MAYPVVVKWLAPVNNAIAETQIVDTNDFFILDGNSVFQRGVPTAIPYNNVSRTISFTALGDSSDVEFVITGTYRNQPQTDTVTGPNANTVYSTNLFDSVTSIQATLNDSTPVSVGFGTTGVTPWMQYDYERSINAVTYQVVVSGTINYTLQQTLDDMNKVSQPSFTFDGTGSLTAQSASAYASSSILPFTFSRLIINSSDNTGSLTLTYLEQGIT